jgi:prepilin peptidase CpaA
VFPHESLAVAAAVAATVCDLRARRIPNALTFGAAVAALIASTWSGGLAGAHTSLLGWLLGLALWLPFFALGGMGAGDVKLLAAVGAWLGPRDVLTTAIYAGLAGAVLALAVVLVRRSGRTTVANLAMLTGHWRVAGITAHPQLTLATSTGPRLPYAVAVLIGTLVTVWL